MSEFVTNAQSLASGARTQRLSGDHHHDTDSEFPLVGYCFDNAYVAYHVFTDAGFDAHLVEGTTERVADGLIANGLNPTEFDSTAELAGHVHYWLLVQHGDGSTVVDIASDSWETLGDCLVTSTLPDDYIELPDSHTEGRKAMQAVREEDTRCRVCGDHRYTHGGCPTCASTVSSDMCNTETTTGG